jgi:hypothetical protein
MITTFANLRAFATSSAIVDASSGAAACGHPWRGSRCDVVVREERERDAVAPTTRAHALRRDCGRCRQGLMPAARRLSSVSNIARSPHDAVPQSLMWFAACEITSYPRVEAPDGGGGRGEAERLDTAVRRAGIGRGGVERADGDVGGGQQLVQRLERQREIVAAVADRGERASRGDEIAGEEQARDGLNGRHGSRDRRRQRRGDGDRDRRALA